MTMDIERISPDELERIKSTSRRPANATKRRKETLTALEAGTPVFFAGRTPQQLTRYYQWARELGFEVSMASGANAAGVSGTAIYRNDEKGSDGND